MADETPTPQEVIDSIVPDEPAASSERELNEWPTKEEVDNFRTDFMEANKPLDNTFIETHPEVFGEHTPEAIDRAAVLLCRFKFGIAQGLHRFGEPGDFAIYILPPGSTVQNHAGESSWLGYGAETDEFGILAEELSKMMSFMDEGTAVSIKTSYGNLTPEEFMEITGVEEAAHKLYSDFNTHKVDIKDDNNAFLGHDHIDAEKRAMLWKTAYARRYFPHLHEDLRARTRQDREIRKEYMTELAEEETQEGAD